MASGLKHYTLTLNGSAQRLIDVMAVTRGSSDDLMCNQVLVQGVSGNAASAFLGNAGVTTTDYGVEITKTGAPISLGPVLSAVMLQEIYVIGTNNDKIHFLFLPA